MTAIEARTLATNLMRAVLAVPGANRSLEFGGKEGLAFVEALGSKHGRWVHEHAGEIYIREIASFRAAHGFIFTAMVYDTATPEERALIEAKPIPALNERCAAVIHGDDERDLTLGADLA